MKVLLVGVGGVGEAMAVIAKDKPWLEKLVLCDYNVDRAKEVQAKLGDAARMPGGVHRRGRQGADRGAGPQARGGPDPQRGGPGVQRGHLRRGLRGRLQLHGHGHDAVHRRTPTDPFNKPAASSWATTSSSAPPTGRRRACWRSWAWAWSRAWPTCSPGTRRSTCSTRSRRSASATAPTWRCGATSSLPTSPSGPPSRSA